MKQRRKPREPRERQNGSVVTCQSHQPTPIFSHCLLLQQAQLELVQAEECEMLEAKSLPLRNYLMRHVLPTVTQGLIEVCKAKPEDPVDYLVCMYVLALYRSVGYQCSGELCFFPPFRLNISSRKTHRLTEISSLYTPHNILDYVLLMRMRIAVSGALLHASRVGCISDVFGGEYEQRERERGRGDRWRGQEGEGCARGSPSYCQRPSHGGRRRRRAKVQQ